MGVTEMTSAARTRTRWLRSLPTEGGIDPATEGRLLAEATAVLGAPVVRWAAAHAVEATEEAHRRLAPEPRSPMVAALQFQRAPEEAILRCLLYVAARDDRFLGASAEMRGGVQYCASQAIPEGTVLGAINIYQSMTAAALLRAADAASTDAAAKGTLMRDISEATLHFWSVFLTEAVDAYREANVQWARSRDAERQSWVKAIMTGEVDVDAATRELNYRFRRTHVGAMVWSPVMAMDSGALVQKVTDALRRIGGDVLVLSDGAGRVIAWVTVDGTLDREALLDELPPRLHVALGNPAPGVAGFRASHREAKAAMHVATLAGAPGRRLTAYTDVSLAYLLACDTQLAGEFVRRKLGPLCASDEKTVILRQTLATYLACEGSVTAAAKKLHVARNTVVYRMNRVRDMLGREWLAHRRLEIECALRLADVLGAQLFSPDFSTDHPRRIALHRDPLRRTPSPSASRTRPG